MEENGKITLQDAMRYIIDTLGNISIPVGLLAVADPEQILAVKKQVIDPVEVARRGLSEILKAYDDGVRAAAEEAQEQEETEDDAETDAE